jgi:hypothetical protein
MCRSEPVGAVAASVAGGGCSVHAEPPPARRFGRINEINVKLTMMRANAQNCLRFSEN